MRGAAATREPKPAARQQTTRRPATTKDRPAAGGTKAAAPSRRLADRRRKFIAAAEQLFLERGFAGASVNEVVRIAGGSLATLYAEFGTKEALFEAVLCQRAAAIFEDGLQEPAHIADVAAELRLLATRMQSRILSADGLAIYRLAVAEAPRFSALRKTVLESGLRGFLKHLSGYFAELAAAGGIRIDNPALAAEQFLTLVQGQQLFIASCGDAARISSASRRQHVQRAVDAFLKIYPPRDQGPRAARAGA
ncbi:MAG TPA: TetR/AcrR family transcriptional regulator [Burkholderiales bacterium]|jgi:AcrR family transcriptional regulator|nr:TetR/AcrR family transcriptional regulator [Burkholderiales bacterium]